MFPLLFCFLFATFRRAGGQLFIITEPIRRANDAVDKSRAAAISFVTCGRTDGRADGQLSF